MQVQRPIQPIAVVTSEDHNIDITTHRLTDNHSMLYLAVFIISSLMLLGSGISIHPKQPRIFNQHFALEWYKNLLYSQLPGGLMLRVN